MMMEVGCREILMHSDACVHRLPPPKMSPDISRCWAGGGGTSCRISRSGMPAVHSALLYQ